MTNPTPELTPAEMSEVLRFGIHNETPGLPEIEVTREAS